MRLIVSNNLHILRKMVKDTA